MTIKILDLFAGAGGFSLGFEQVRDKSGKKVFELFRAAEIDKHSCETLRKRYGSKKVIEGDLTKFPISKKVIDECKNKVSVIIGGIPCQSFSLIGTRSGFGKRIEKFRKDERDNLYEHFRDIVAEVKPNIIVIENVRGILSKKDNHNKRIIDKITSDFEILGYSFENKKKEKWHILNSANYGVPQKRERVILIGIKKSWKNKKIPDITPTHFDPSSYNAEEMVKKGLKPYVTVYESIGDLPKVYPKITLTGVKNKKKVEEKNRKINNGKENIEHKKSIFLKHLERISQQGNEFFDFVRPNGHKFIDHHVARSQQISDIRLFRLMKQGETAKDFAKRMPKAAEKLIKYNLNTFKDKYRKQKANDASTTVFAHLEKDGNRFIHPSQARTYTPREAARIQSFPDHIKFEGPMSKKFRQIGNAVPPLMSKRIAEEIYNELIIMN